LDSVIVIQARTSSTRLPGKVMLPVKGFPLVVLAAKRASNTGRSVVITTSNEPSDDGLVALIKSYDLKYFRGSLENTLGRIVKALAEYDDKTIVFRLTSDNIFPDGLLLDEIEGEFLAKGHEYLCCNGEPSGLPYGMSVEVTRLGNLREADAMSTSAHDQEHVTPYIKRKYGEIFFEKYKYLNKGHYRCTIDCLDDYLSILSIFSDVIDPVQVSSLKLVQLLERKHHQPIAEKPTPKLVFGTAQLGGNYGIANKTGQPDLSHCQDMIKTALANGVIYLDTARAYGNSEAMIGSSLGGGWDDRVKIISKLSPLQDCKQGMTDSVLNSFIDASIYKSCNLLRVQKIDVLMLHRASHMIDWNGKVWDRLLELKLAGKIGELGASVQSPEELSEVLKNEEIRYIQLPFNLLDWRWDSIILMILSIKEKRKLTIHVRSALLQGVLPSLDDSHWLRANVENPALIKSWLVEQVRNYQRASVADLCLSYINALTWVDGIAVGMENMTQLLENVNYFNLPPMSESQVEEIQKSRPRLTEESLNPTLWKN
jgi:spore coat polysaccharide biosynthesis protein SpsF (cytidylyltransferase family)/aryl-alcohol dehydrogenase-like predicted oxidoreductase